MQAPKDSGVGTMRVCDSPSGKNRAQIGDAAQAGKSPRRTSARRKTYLNGRIVFNLGRSSMSVRVRDLSADGTRLCLSIPWPCPRRFMLEIDRNAPALPVIRKCEVVWQRGMTLGVRFLEQHEPATARSIAR